MESMSRCAEDGRTSQYPQQDHRRLANVADRNCGTEGSQDEEGFGVSGWLPHLVESRDPVSGAVTTLCGARFDKPYLWDDPEGEVRPCEICAGMKLPGRKYSSFVADAQKVRFGMQE